MPSFSSTLFCFLINFPTVPNAFRSGTDVSFERDRLGRINILVCTPGRLLQHMDENEQMNCDNLLMLVIDEADRILDMGFKSQV